MMQTYVLNTAILTNYGTWRLSGPLTCDEAKKILEAGFVSAIGHAATAELMSRLLSIEIQTQRIAIKFGVGDRSLVFRLKERLPEGLVLNTEQLEKLDYEFSLLERLE